MLSTLIEHSGHTSTAANLTFLNGGGEMGELIRAYNWSDSPLGKPETWPPNLCSAVSLMLSSRFPMFIWWGEEMIQFYNDAYRPSLGENGKHPAIGQRGEDCWKEIWPVIKPLIDEVWAGGSTWNEDQLIPIYRNGCMEDVYWTFSYSPLKDDTGAVHGVLVICHETTDKIKATKKLETVEKKFRNIVKQAPVGIAILRGRNFTIEMANAYYCLLMNKTEDEMTGQPFFEVLPETKAIIEPLLLHVLKTGNTCYSFEYETMDRNFNFTYQPLRDETGEIEGVIIVSNEVTEEVKARTLNIISARKYDELKENEELLEKRVEERTNELKVANFNLQRSNKELEQFAFVASHDMQEPLRKIRMFTELLKSNLQNTSESNRGYLDKITSAASRMRNLINDVLYYSRLSAPESATKHTALNELVKQVISDFELLIQEKNALVTVGPLPELEANPLQLTQLFTNLLSNSLKFNNSQRPEISITSSVPETLPEGLDDSRKYYRIIFKDNGIGFDPQYAEQIFTIFQRLHTRQEYSGTGIGLALCKKIALNHQGNIYAFSENNKGAEFHVYLPPARV